MDQKIIDLYSEYTHAPLPRRVFLERLAAALGGTAAIPAVLAELEPNYAQAAQVAGDDARIRVERVTVATQGFPISAYLARPKAVDKAPTVVVVHENRGLNLHIEDVARRLAVAGFAALAPDLLSPLGGTPSDADKARDMINTLDPAQVVADVVDIVTFLQNAPYGKGKVGAIGFCWGGGVVDRLAARAPAGLKAVVSFYGPPPEPALVPAIKAPLLLHYAELDTFVNPKVPAFEAALKAAGVPYTLYMYPGVNHAFHNDTSAERYNAEAANLAWGRSVEFLHKNLD